MKTYLWIIATLLLAICVMGHLSEKSWESRVIAAGGYPY